MRRIIIGEWRRPMPRRPPEVSEPMFGDAPAPAAMDGTPWTGTPIAAGHLAAGRGVFPPRLARCRTEAYDGRT